MYSDLFEQFSSSGRHSSNEAAVSSSDPKPLVSFKAGKVDLDWDGTVFRCTPDPTRGEVRLVWTDRALHWQFYSRRDKKVLETVKITPNEHSAFERVPLPQKEARVYVWTRKEGTYDMYWMQDASEEKEDEVVSLVNQYLVDPLSAKPNDETPAVPADQANNETTNNVETSSNQVDALSSILENLGMPQATTGSSTESTPNAANNNGAQRQLTLEDLQGAMAGMVQQQHHQSSTAGPSLSEVVTPGAISGILENEQACQRLIALLPEAQQSREFLEENLRSPQVQQTLRSLTQALLPDDSGNLDGFYSVLANFSLDPADANDALVQANNPIQAFLDALLAKVEREQQEESKK